jgi:rhamnosyltransferase
MSERPRVLVLLAMRNGADVLNRQLRSVLVQEGVDVHLDVRDDGSTDASRELVSDLAAYDSRVRLRADHDASGSAAGNFFRLIAGAQLANFTHVAFSDQDDEWHLNKLKRAAMRMDGEAADGYSAGVEALWPDGRKKILIQHADPSGADHLFEGAGQGCTFVMTVTFFSTVQATLQLHRSSLAKIHYHDWTIYALARTLGHRWVIDDAATMTYHQHGGNDTGARGSTGSILWRLSRIADGWYASQVDAIAGLMHAVSPTDPMASKWLQLVSARDQAGWRGRWQRLQFVATHGRRRRVDRTVLLGAVLLGYL